MRSKIDYTNQVFHDLTVLYPSEKRIKGEIVWLCRCKCGKETLTRSSYLKSGRKKSCGCIQKDYYRTHKKITTYGLTKLYNEYKVSAKSKNREFNLTKEEFRQLTSKNCFYCNIAPYRKRINIYAKNKITIEMGEFIFNGLDRINSSKDYTLDNVLTCCKVCNCAKSNLTTEEFKEWLERIYNHFIKI